MEVRDIEKLAKEWKTIRKKKETVEKKYLKELKSFCKEKYTGKVIRVGDFLEIKVKQITTVQVDSIYHNIRMYVTGEALEKHNYCTYAKRYGRYQETFVAITDTGDLLQKYPSSVSDDVKSFDKEYEYWKEMMKKQHTTTKITLDNYKLF